MLYGLNNEEWSEAKEEIRHALIAVAESQTTIPYSKLVQEVHSVELEPDSRALAHLLGEISTDEDAAGRGMLTVVVVHKDGDMKPGPGFFQLAKKVGRDTSDKDQCWIDELQHVYAAWTCVSK